MYVGELSVALEAFRPEGVVTVAVPTTGGPHRVRATRLVGHLDQPGEDVNPELTCDICVDPWDEEVRETAAEMTVGVLADRLARFPEGMPVRVVVPFAKHDSWTHRMLDIASVAVVAGSGVQIVTENWDLMTTQVVRVKEGA